MSFYEACRTRLRTNSSSFRQRPGRLRVQATRRKTEPGNNTSPDNTRSPSCRLSSITSHMHVRFTSRIPLRSSVFGISFCTCQNGISTDGKDGCMSGPTLHTVAHNLSTHAISELSSTDLGQALLCYRERIHN